MVGAEPALKLSCSLSRRAILLSRVGVEGFETAADESCCKQNALADFFIGGVVVQKSRKQGERYAGEPRDCELIGFGFLGGQAGARVDAVAEKVVDKSRDFRALFDDEMVLTVHGKGFDVIPSPIDELHDFVDDGSVCFLLGDFALQKQEFSWEDFFDDGNDFFDDGRDHCGKKVFFAIEKEVQRACCYVCVPADDSQRGFLIRDARKLCSSGREKIRLRDFT